jgi:O-antigen/teichoic acid export membrane protein
MFQELKRLIKDSCIYGVGTVSRSLIGFALIPLYTRFLSPEEYGILSLALVALASLIILYEFGMGKALFRFYFDTDLESEKKAVVGSCFLIIVALGIPLLTVLVLSSQAGSSLTLSSDKYSALMVIVALTAFFEALITLPYAVLRAKMQSKRYTFFFLLNLFLLLLLTFLFVAVFKRGITGVLVARLISSTIIFLCLLPILLNNATFSWRRLTVKSLMLYGLPFVPLGLIGWALRYVNRYFLEHFTSLDTMGIYSLGCQIGMGMIIFVVAPFQLVWAPYKFIIAKQSDARDKFSVFFTYFLLLAAFVGLGLSSMAEEIVKIMSTPPFYGASAIVPYVVVAYILYGLSFNFNIGIDLEKKTYLLPLITGAGLVVGLILNYLLIPKYGMSGAARAFTASYAILPILMYYVSRTYYKIRYEFRRLVQIAAVSIFLFWISTLLSRWNLSVWTAVSIKMLIVLMYFPLLLSVGFLSTREKVKLRYLWKKAMAIPR